MNLSRVGANLWQSDPQSQTSKLQGRYQFSLLWSWVSRNLISTKSGQLTGARTPAGWALRQPGEQRAATAPGATAGISSKVHQQQKRWMSASTVPRWNTSRAATVTTSPQRRATWTKLTAWWSGAARGGRGCAGGPRLCQAHRQPH